MHPDLPLLVELQSVDREIARLTAEIAALPKHVAEIEARLKTHVDQLEHDRKVLATHQKERKEHDREILVIREKIAKYRDQMASVKTNDQYRALQHEIDFAEQGIRGHEDKILDMMVLDEELEAAVKRAQAKLDAEKKEVEKEKAAVQRRTADDEAELTRNKTTRQEIAGKITEKALAEYTRLSRKPPAALLRKLQADYCLRAAGSSGRGCRPGLVGQLVHVNTAGFLVVFRLAATSASDGPSFGRM
jgi:predicted  nucleic acid-binding Zn-ribbon protein